MKRILKLCIILIVLILLLVVSLLFPIFSNNAKVAGVTINQQAPYDATNNVILGGKTKSDTVVLVFFTGKIGMTTADQHGNWSANLGKLAPGAYPFEAVAQTSSTANSVAATEITVVSHASLAEAINHDFSAALSMPLENLPAPIVTVPENSPAALQGKWSLMQ